MAETLRRVPPVAATCCPACGRALPVEYVRMGAAVRCPACFAWTVPQVPKRGHYPRTEDESSFEDFRRLIETESSRGAIAALLGKWFGYSVSAEGEDVRVWNATGEAIDPLWLHLRIQGDAERRGEFYFTKMSLWR